MRERNLEKEFTLRFSQNIHQFKNRLYVKVIKNNTQNYLRTIPVMVGPMFGISTFPTSFVFRGSDTI